MKRVITVSGEVASGKSTVSREILQLLPNWQYINTGDRFREFCASKGMSIQQVSFLPDDVHREFDELQKSEAKNGSNLIIEGRLTGWLTREISHVFRVFCKASLDVRAERYILREQCSIDKAKEDIEYRDSRDVLKYRKVYNIYDYRDPVYYSMIIDTSKKKPKEIAMEILKQAGLFPDNSSLESGV